MVELLEFNQLRWKPLHPLSSKHLVNQMELQHPYAAVIAVRNKKTLVVKDGSFLFVKKGAKFAPLKDTGFEVVSEDGKPIQPTGDFYISLDTFDPCHTIIDWFRPK
ncbi:hypothetical protein [Paenibacillus taichungensis]